MKMQIIYNETLNQSETCDIICHSRLQAPNTTLNNKNIIIPTHRVANFRLQPNLICQNPLQFNPKIQASTKPNSPKFTKIFKL